MSRPPKRLSSYFADHRLPLEAAIADYFGFDRQATNISDYCCDASFIRQLSRLTRCSLSARFAPIRLNGMPAPAGQASRPRSIALEKPPIKMPRQQAGALAAAQGRDSHYGIRHCALIARHFASSATRPSRRRAARPLLADYLPIAIASQPTAAYLSQRGIGGSRAEFRRCHGRGRDYEKAAFSCRRRRRSRRFTFRYYAFRDSAEAVNISPHDQNILLALLRWLPSMAMSTL